MIQRKIDLENEEGVNIGTLILYQRGPGMKIKARVEYKEGISAENKELIDREDYPRWVEEMNLVNIEKVKYKIENYCSDGEPEGYGFGLDDDDDDDCCECCCGG